MIAEIFQSRKVSDCILVYNSVYVGVNRRKYFITDGISQFSQGIDTAGGVVLVVDDSYHLAEINVWDVGYVD